MSCSEITPLAKKSDYAGWDIQEEVNAGEMAPGSSLLLTKASQHEVESQSACLSASFASENQQVEIVH
jgi:hypothetical protein